MRRTVAIAGATLLLGGAFALGLGVTTTRDRPGELAAGPRDDPVQVLDQVRNLLIESYYRDVPPSVLARNSVDAILLALDDPYTDYLTPAEYDALRDRTADTYSGIGLTVAHGRRGLIVRDAVPGPAREAGIRPGDRIVSIDGKRIRSLPFDRSLRLIRGPEGTLVRLTITRPREGRFELTVRRSRIEHPAVRSRMLRGRIGYVRVLSFRASAVDAIASRASTLLDSGARGLVLDLRGNPGGLFSQAVGTVSLFLADGVVCVTQGAHQGRRVTRVTGRAPLADVRLVVLVDSESASAAEVVAAALDDNGRAPIVGETTYGKTSVQSLRELTNGAALKLTTAVFLTPDGRNLTLKGVRPDVAAVDEEGTRRDEALLRATTVLRKSL
jgi:carboxyl-terminal processing protease